MQHLKDIEGYHFSHLRAEVSPVILYQQLSIRGDVDIGLSNCSSDRQKTSLNKCAYCLCTVHLGCTQIWQRNVQGRNVKSESSLPRTFLMDDICYLMQRDNSSISRKKTGLSGQRGWDSCKSREAGSVTKVKKVEGADPSKPADHDADQRMLTPYLRTEYMTYG